MPNLSIKDVPEALAEQLRQRAARNHRSLQGELMALLEVAAGEATSTFLREPAVTAYVAPPLTQVPQTTLTHEAYVRRIDELAAQVNPEFRAADRLTREQANDRAYLRGLGI